MGESLAEVISYLPKTDEMSVDLISDFGLIFTLKTGAETTIRDANKTMLQKTECEHLDDIIDDKFSFVWRKNGKKCLQELKLFKK